MRLTTFLLVVILSSTSHGKGRGSFNSGPKAPTSVKGSFRTGGKFVMPHYRSAPDGHRFNNWGTKGNFNPYTGKSGRKDLLK